MKFRDVFTHRFQTRAFASIACLASVALLGACAAPAPKVAVNNDTLEYFSEAEYGVKASPRVTDKRSRLRRGGGRMQVGKPYKVKGQWYYPEEDPDYDESGLASWYGSAFHGRLTANGEIYDMTHLTAAHPTMPLPSYARVTNLKNGRSVVVRVNDRGPFAHNRVIDLSQRAAEMLDYTSNGVAKVRVQYVGRAPLHGLDDEYLLASYQPGPDEPYLGQSGGVMVAMRQEERPPEPFSRPTLPGVDSRQGIATLPAAAQREEISPSEIPPLPEIAPVPVRRPPAGLAAATFLLSPVTAYNAMQYDRTTLAFRKLLGGDAAARSHYPDEKTITVIAGNYSSPEDAREFAESVSLSEYAMIETEFAGQAQIHSLTFNFPERSDVNGYLEAIWQAGASDAFIVRN